MKNALLLMAFVASSAVAESATSFADPARTAPVSPVAGMAQSVVALLIVIAVMFALVWLFRRISPTGPGSARGMAVVQGISVGSKERAVVIQVDGKRLLLGVAPGQVTLLKELEDVVALNVGEAASKSVHAVAFKDILKRSLGLKGNDRS